MKTTKRVEDRRKGHTVSLILGLMTAGGRRDEVTLHLIGEAAHRTIDAPSN